jgi:uncharacterized protein (TIGR02217 family)
VRSLDDLAAVIAFFEARHGQLYGFRWKDWTDFKSCAPSGVPSPLDQEIGRGDGATTVFALKKAYRSGGVSYERPIAKPVEGTVRVAVAGVELDQRAFAVDSATGVVTLFQPPAQNQPVSAGFEFDVPVRFDTDGITASLASLSAGEIPSIPLIEVRV